MHIADIEFDAQLDLDLDIARDLGLDPDLFLRRNLVSCAQLSYRKLVEAAKEVWPAEPFDEEAEEIVMADPRPGVDAWVRVDGYRALRDAVAAVWVEDLEDGVVRDFRFWVLDKGGEFAFFNIVEWGKGERVTCGFEDCG